MKTPNIFAKKEKGQVLVFGAIIFLIVLIPLAALVIDGSIIMLNRRQAQAAADAGALAGAKDLCKRDPDQAKITAGNYVTSNNATLVGEPIITYDVSTTLGEITVTASVSRPSFFAKLIGYPTLASSAPATAGCFIPTKLSHLLPLAWSCFHLIEDLPDHPGSFYCDTPSIKWADLPTADTSGKLSIFIDAGGGSYATKPETICQGDTNIIGGVAVAGTMVCDLPGIGQVFGGGARSWLNLTGANSAPGVNDERNWLTNGYPGFVEIGQILNGQPGASNQVYQAVPDDSTKPWVLPVMQQLSDTQWKVVGFSWFFISCVEDNPNLPSSYNPATWDVTKYNKCPGGQAWLQANREKVSFYQKGYTVEGYLVSDYHPVEDPSGNGTYDFGVYYVSLIK